MRSRLVVSGPVWAVDVLVILATISSVLYFKEYFIGDLPLTPTLNDTKYRPIAVNLFVLPFQLFQLLTKTLSNGKGDAFSAFLLLVTNTAALSLAKTEKSHCDL